MCNRRNLNYNLNRFQERTQRTIYSDKCSTFSQLLEKENSVAVLYKRNLQYLVIEIFEVKIGMSSAIVTEIFKFCGNATHNLRRDQILEHRDNRTNDFGVESILTLGAKIWALVHGNLRQSSSLNSFKQGIKKWNPSNCSFRLCNAGVQDVRFI